jgi:nitrate/TMAO reductase-like tetraheme cytochrome c subunit
VSASGIGAAAEEPPRSPFIAVFTSHWLAMLGVGLVLTAIVMWACLLPAELRRGGQDNPYVGLATAAAAIVLIIGAVLTPIGLFFGRRRLKKRIVGSLANPKSPWWRLLVFLGVTSLINVLIASQATLRVVHKMESREFCGSCHVMTPESRAFTEGPHAGILCVDCHVGEGTKGYIQSKIQGTHQLISVMTDSVKKPIESAIESGRMIPSAETCEQCHWKDQPAAAKLRLIQTYGEDEANTPETTLLTMNVGGSQMGGIHGAHHGEGVEIHFVAEDAKRQEIPLVEYRNAKTGEHKVYLKEGKDAASYAGRERIQMQCFDCHNRPAHAFQLPDRAVDRALLLGRMSATLPFLKRNALEVLKAEYASSEAAAAAIPAAFAKAYEAEPEVAKERAEDIRTAGAVLADIYSRNVFPELGVTWGTYPDNRGHETSPGCFRCHGGEHATEAGEKITNNCYKCHHPAAIAETAPEILELLGVDRMMKGLKRK